MEEIWKLIEDEFDARYEVSNLGNVRVAKGQYKGKILRQYYTCFTNGRYNNVELHYEGRKHIGRVHRMVAKVFCENPNNYPIVLHIDNNRRNNAASNLRWGTLKMNTQQCIQEGRFNRPKGSKHYNAKLTEEAVIHIRSKYIPRKYSMYKLAKEYNVTQSLINHVLKGRAWNHI